MGQKLFEEKFTPRIGDIQTSDLRYYDPDLEDHCFKFCQKRDFDCLPAFDHRRIYTRNEADFEAEEVKEERKVNDEVGIFDPEMLKKFQKRRLLMVYHENDLTGVVHFSDYNEPVVSSHLYNLFFSYEKALRELLIQMGYNNCDMIDYFKEKMAKGRDPKTIESYNEKIKDYNNKGRKKKAQPFEVFYLKDLTSLINHENIIKKVHDFAHLRNMVMHANEFVHVEDPKSDVYIYDFAQFKEFFCLAIKLHLCHRQIWNRITIERELKDERKTPRASAN